jgi:transposase
MAESKARQEAIIADLKTKTMFAYEIAEKYGVSTGLIHLIAKKYDVGMSPSEAIKMRYARAKAS